MTLSYARSGQSDHPLVLLHALPLDKTMFDALLPLLDDVITFSAPGFDGSQPGQVIQETYGYDEPQLEAYADAVISCLDKLGVTNFDIGGVSMGGPVALWVTRKVPQRVGHLILMDTNIGADTAEAAQGRREKAAQADEGDISSVFAMKDTMTAQKTQDERVDLYRDIDTRLQRVPGPGLAWLQRAMANRPDQRAELAQLTTPVLLLRGAEDASCSSEMFDELQELRADAERVTISDAGHFSPMETPREVAQAISAFIS